MTKTKVVVSRKWKNPEVEAWVNNDAVGVNIALPAFLESLVEEVGNPTKFFTKAALLTALQAAAIEVCSEMKKATKKVV